MFLLPLVCLHSLCLTQKQAEIFKNVNIILSNPTLGINLEFCLIRYVWLGSHSHLASSCTHSPLLAPRGLDLLVSFLYL